MTWQHFVYLGQCLTFSSYVPGFAHRIALSSFGRTAELCDQSTAGFEAISRQWVFASDVGDRATGAGLDLVSFFRRRAALSDPSSLV